MATQDMFKIDSLDQLKLKISGGCFDPTYFSRPKLKNEMKIREAMKSIGVMDLHGQEMPHWEGPFRTGKHLDVGAHLSGRERCMYRKVAIPDGEKLAGKRIVCQLALMCDQTLDNVLQRALPSIALAARLQEDGHTVSLMFCWASYRHGSGAEYNRASFTWIEAKDISVRTIAQILDPEFFQSWIFSFRRNDGPNGKIGHGLSGGESATVEYYSAFVKEGKRCKVINDGDICLDWNLPINAQIEQGMKIVEGD